MSMLPPEVQTALRQLLGALQSSDNVARAEAEERLAKDWQQARPDMLLMGLVENLGSSAGEDDVGNLGA